MLIQKVDEEDGLALSNVSEYPDSPKESTPNPDYTQKKSEVVTKPEPAVEPVVEETTFEKVEVDEDGDGVNDGYDTDGDGDVDEYFEHRNCEHVWGDADGDGFEECQICGLLRSQTEE
jgi:hypothetical protein